LFPSLLDASVNAGAYATVDEYIDALVAPARAQNRDRYFTYLTSIAEENAYYQQGETAGFGIRLEVNNQRLFVSEVFEGGSAIANGFDRGTEILQIGTPGAGLRNVGEIMASGGTAAIFDALGPDTQGTVRQFVFRDSAGVQRSANLSKIIYELDPVSNTYGAKVIMDGAKRVGYINLRTFIDTAELDLRAAFSQFKAQGVTELIIDLRYNGGGLISVAELVGDLMAEGRAGQIFEYISYRDSKASLNESYAFRSLSEAIAPTKVAFIATGGTASASEMVINGMVPFLGTNMALIGENTYGKPVGQIALDRPACDDRLRAIALKIENANHQGEYYNGLATTVPVTCSATDDLAHQLGDPNERMISVALDFLAGRSCNSIATAKTAASIAGVTRGETRALLTRATPQSTPERELPGAF
jgi:C-terminal processing protease CtpA/Prc